MTTQRTTFNGKKAFGHLEHLAVTIGARLTGSAGEHRAARYIARIFKSFGLKVTLQQFPCITFSNRVCTFEVRRGRRWRKLPSEPVMLSKSTPPGGIEGEIYYAEDAASADFTAAMKDKIVLVCGRLTAEARHRLIGYGPKALVSIDPTLREGFRRAVLHDESRKTYGNLPMAAIGHLDGLEIVRKGGGRGRLVLRTTEKKYELVVYAMVDSLILHGGYANIRLESFLFTEQAFGSNIAGAGSARRSRCCWTGSTNVCELASVRTSWLP